MSTQFKAKLFYFFIVENLEILLEESYLVCKLWPKKLYFSATVRQVLLEATKSTLCVRPRIVMKPDIVPISA